MCLFVSSIFLGLYFYDLNNNQQGEAQDKSIEEAEESQDSG